MPEVWQKKLVVFHFIIFIYTLVRGFYAPDFYKKETYQIMYKLILNTKLPTLNEYVNKMNKNRFVANNLKKSTENKIMFLAKELKFTLPENAKFYIAFEWYNYNRFDNDNVEFAQKFILDALQKANILVNDNKKYINNIKIHVHLKDKKHNSVYQNVLFFTDKEEFTNYINKIK